eukprot:jgi/Bigna1/135047/aug1.27_g9755
MNPVEFKMDLEDVPFDLRRHLQYEPPSHVKTLEFKDVPFPYSPEIQRNFPGIAYTRPFRLLSDEGTRILKSIVMRYKDAHLKQNERNKCLRGLGYLSKWVRDFTFNPEVNKIFADLSLQPLSPHNGIMNHGHTNFGEPGAGRAVDQWHVDSTDYVCVLILSDMTDMDGGELQVLQMADATGKFFDDLMVKGVPKSKVETVNYKGAGYCVFMQGSKILHSVTPVLKARGPRISFVQSFSNRNVFADDRTRLVAFRDQFDDPDDVANLEYARHKAWRVKGQMQYIAEKLKFGTSEKELASIFANAAKELLKARKLLLREISDLPGFLVNEKDKVTTSGKDRGTKEKDDSKEENGAPRAKL